MSDRRPTWASFVNPDGTSPGWLALRYLYLFTGLTVLGIGIAYTLEAGLGLSPWSVFHEGLARRTGFTFGQVLQWVGVAVIVLSIPFGIWPTLATVLNMVWVGVVVDVVRSGGWITPPNGAIGQWFDLAIGTAVLGLGTGMYISAHLGAGPRDTLMLALVRGLGWRVGVVRSAIEGTVLVVGALLGGPVGWGTIFAVLTIGPAVEASLRFFALCSRLPGLGRLIEVPVRVERTGAEPASPGD